MANWVSRAWTALFYHKGNRYFLLPQSDSAQPGPPNEGPFGDAGPALLNWLSRATWGNREATPLFYTLIGVWLALVTVLEVWLFTLDDEFGAFFVPIMLILAFAKFATVVAFYMHLRFDNKLLSLVFASGFIIAIAVFIIMLTVQGQVIPEKLTPA